MAKVDALLPPLAAGKKPVAVATMGDEAPLPEAFAPSFRDRGIPVFRSPERALRAMAHATWYGSTPDHTSGMGGPHPALDLPARSGALPEHAGKRLIARLGIRVPRGVLVHSPEQAQSAAREIGYPVVLKAQSPALTHKTEAGGVITGIAGADALATAWARLHGNIAGARPDLVLDGVLLEQMAPPGLDMVVGARRDPDWGPLVMVGLGGIWVEALEDVQLIPAEATTAAIAEAVSQLKAARVLAGLRGKPPMDVAALVEAVAQIAALMRAEPRVSEIDVNPLVVYPQGQGVLALDTLLVLGAEG
jgi:acyl-CoA synthetase (NDP forming)